MIKRFRFGKTKTGSAVSLYRIWNGNGAELAVTDYGARLVSLLVPDRNGKPTDVVLGYDRAERYGEDGFCFGATIGRCANRTAGARFSLNGREYQLYPNENGNNNHSGPEGYQDRMWNAMVLGDGCLGLSLLSEHMDQGFPGRLKVSVTYSLAEDNSVEIHFMGVSDEDTVINLTHHSYFNLNGHGNGDVLDQYLKISACRYSPVYDAQWIPTGEHAPVAGTPMDFRDFKKIGRDLENSFSQIRIGKGYNHNYFLEHEKCAIGSMAEAYSERTGIRMSAYTNLPAMQLYTAGYLPAVIGKEGHIYNAYGGFCLEPQYTPNAVNTDGEEKPVFRAGEMYDKKVIFRFDMI